MNQKVKIIFNITLMIAIWFSMDLIWYYNFKNFYKLKVNDVVLNIRQGRGGIKITVNSIDDDNFYIFCENEEKLKIGDSISKKNNSDEIKIYRKSNEKWNLETSLFIRKDLDYYSLIIEK